MTFSFDSRDYTCWEDIVHRLQRSKDPTVKDHLFWGVDEAGQIKLCDRALARNHCQFLGGTGTGKTAFAMLPFIVQDIMAKCASVSMLDFKGDQFSFRTMGEAAHCLRVPFKYVTLESDRASYGYFPLKQACWKRLTVEERTQILVSAMGLESGDADPNLAYWAITNETFLRGVLEICPEAETFGELYNVAKDPATGEKIGMGRRAVEHAAAVVSHLSRLANIPQINGGTADVERAAVNIRECLETLAHTYMRFPAQRVPSTGRAVARLFATQLVAEARSIGKAPVAQVLAIDEFHHVAQRSFVDILKQARNLGIACYLAHQNLSDLEAGTQSLLDAVVGNTNVRVMFSATDALGKKHLKESSVRSPRLLRGASKTVTESGDGTLAVAKGDSLQELLEERMTPEVIARLNATKGLAAVEAYPNSGQTKLNGVTLLYMPAICSKTEYDRRENLPWPELNAFTMLGSNAPDTLDEEPGPEPPPADGPMPKPIPPKKPRRPRISKSGEQPATDASNQLQRPTSSLAQHLFELTEAKS